MYSHLRSSAKDLAKFATVAAFAWYLSACHPVDNTLPRALRTFCTLLQLQPNYCMDVLTPPNLNSSLSYGEDAAFLPLETFVPRINAAQGMVPAELLRTSQGGRS